MTPTSSSPFKGSQPRILVLKSVTMVCTIMTRRNSSFHLHLGQRANLPFLKTGAPNHDLPRPNFTPLLAVKRFPPQSHSLPYIVSSLATRPIQSFPQLPKSSLAPVPCAPNHAPDPLPPQIIQTSSKNQLQHLNQPKHRISRLPDTRKPAPKSSPHTHTRTQNHIPTTLPPLSSIPASPLQMALFLPPRQSRSSKKSYNWRTQAAIESHTQAKRKRWRRESAPSKLSSSSIASQGREGTLLCSALPCLPCLSSARSALLCSAVSVRSRSVGTNPVGR